MTDKYEEFKEWFKKNKYGVWKVIDFEIPLTAETVINPSVVFDIFEEEQAEKEKEREIKKTIKEALKDQRCNLYAIDGYAYVVYKALKEKDLIK